MKLKKFVPELVVRIEIISGFGIRGEKKECKTLTLEETNTEAVYEWTKSLFENQKVRVDVDPLSPMPKIRVGCYNMLGKKKGKYKSFTIYALPLDFVYATIIDKLDK